ncbi:MAG: sigma-70 family RNA polymerase sigma factor [Defluviitaleaceae bacterium]|nr:sigma-70 family RNA polymerase sigma factor [Defluviitaleaceae bacterium]
MPTFEEIIIKYDKMIFNLARRLMGNADDAQDVAQEVAIKVYKNLHKCKGEEYLAAWISRITHNACMDALRKKKGKKTESLDEFMEFDGDEFGKQIPATDSTPEELLLQKEVSSQIEDALTKLPIMYRTLVILRDVQGYSYEEVAEISGLALGTVKSRIFRGRGKLKETLLELMKQN